MYSFNLILFCIFIINVNLSKFAFGEERESDGTPFLSNEIHNEDALNLSPEEIRGRLHKLAKKIDTNKDGYVDSEELYSWVDNSFKSLSEEEAYEQMQEADVNGDGYVTWQEQTNFSSDLGSIDDDSNLELYKNERELFKAADLDGDGKLDRKEYHRFSNPEEFQDMHDILYSDLMEKKDKDKDGSLSMEEFLVGLDPDTDNYLIEKERFEQELDWNHDGYLDKEETLNWLIPPQQEIVKSEADYLLDKADLDNDGRLSPEEIAQQQEVFVSSEATNFGEDLHRIKDEL